MLFLCTRLGMMVTQMECKIISLDDELSILQGIVKLVGLIFLAKVPRLWSVLILNMIVKSYHVAEENCVCVLCKRERERSQVLYIIKQYESIWLYYVWMKVNQGPWEGHDRPVLNKGCLPLGTNETVTLFCYQEFLEPETYYSNVTCNTQVFSYPLLSSTPLVGQLKQPSDRNAADSSANTWDCQ
jgi:hypothetical protein